MNAPVTQSEQTALAVAPRQQFDLSPQNFEQALTLSNYLAESELVPKDYRNKPGNCLIAIQWGAEIGLKPLQALQNIAPINGRPALWGDAVIALVRNSPLCEYVSETDDGETATCKVKRRGENEQSRTFSMADAKAAGLFGKQGPWTQYPKRMRQMRARAFALRDVFPDVLRGLPVAEEVMDMPTERHMGAADVVGAPPPAPKPEKPEFDDAQFKKRRDKLIEFFKAGKSAEEIISFYGSKSTIPEAMAKRIRDLHAEVTKPVTDVEPKVTYATVADALHKSNDLESLDAAADLINAVADEDQRAELSGIYGQRREAIEAAN